MSCQNAHIKKRHNFYTSETINKCKSDVNIFHPNLNVKRRSLQEYYKKYDHDDLPVKDDCSFNDHSFSEGHDSGTGDNKDSITNSDLDNLEMKVMNKMSQELQTDASTVSSLDSNIKLFKTTVQNIFDNFYSSMKDFEEYKRKFNEIIARNKGDSVNELEDFISNVIHHIRSSESSISRTRSDDVPVSENRKLNANGSFGLSDYGEINNETSVLNEIYTTTDHLEDCLRVNSSAKIKDAVNIYLANETPCLDIKATSRHIVSELNIRDQLISGIGHLASADDMKKLAAKELELEKYTNQEELYNVLDSRPDIDIPVKNSCAKKNIHLDEDFDNEQDKENNSFFIFRICSYICKKFRKN